MDGRPQQRIKAYRGQASPDFCDELDSTERRRRPQMQVSRELCEDIGYMERHRHPRMHAPWDLFEEFGSMERHRNPRVQAIHEKVPHELCDIFLGMGI